MTVRVCTVSLVGQPAHRSTLAEVWTALLGVAGGGLGVELVRRWSFRRRQQEQQSAALELRILDDGDKLRAQLFAESKEAREALAAMTERAHAAELRAAVLETKLSQLSARLDRKDEQNKALMAQLAGLGQVPCVLAAPAGRSTNGGPT